MFSALAAEVCFRHRGIHTECRFLSCSFKNLTSEAKAEQLAGTLDGTAEADAPPKCLNLAEGRRLEELGLNTVLHETGFRLPQILRWFAARIAI